MFTMLQAAPAANLPFLFAAFAITWVVFFAYVFLVSRRRQEAERELRELKQVLDEQDQGDTPS